MSLVTPVPQNTIIKLYKGVGWCNSNKDVRLFTSEAQRESYLTARILAGGVFSNCSIVDIGRSIRVQGKLNNLIAATYMSFQNVEAGTTARTFYAFVTAVNYVNVNTVEITYQIDWIQSYLFDFSWESCFVEREHVNNDAIGANTVPENMDTVEYCIRNVTNHIYQSAILTQLLNNEVTARAYGGVVSGLDAIAYNIGNLGAFSDDLQGFRDAPENVAALTMGVQPMVSNAGWATEFTETFTVGKTAGFAFKGETYTAKNNKLNCYPYMFLTVDNFMGDMVQLHWELGGFESANGMDFRVYGCPMPKPTMQCYPLDYMGVNTSMDYISNTCEQFAVTYDDFPQIAWTTDAYRAWMSQIGGMKIASAAAEVTINVVGGAMAAASGNYIGAAMLAGQTAEEIGQTYQEVRNHQIHSRELRGTVGTSGLQFAKEQVGFRVTQYAIKPEWARRLDAFFTRYGYRVDTPKVPNITGRSVVNYVKCREAKVGGNIPVDAKDLMESMLNSGVSFWHNDNIGSTVTDNPIVS